MNISNAVLNIKIEDIVPNRFQPREHFADDGIEELAASIKEHGIIQPLVLRKLGDKFEIVAGERRYKAATLAGLTHVPAIISDIDDEKSAEVALVENIQRRNLSPIEEARSYKAILDKSNMTQEELATKMGVSQSQVANKLRLLNLCEEVQEALLTQKISERHARTLLSVYDYDEQRKWLNRIINERLTVRQLDMELKKEQSGNNGANVLEENNIPLVNINPDLDNIKQNATDLFDKPIEKDVSNFLVPDENIAKIDEANKPVPEATPETENKVEEEKEEPLNTNRFFNFLEDEGPNMNMEEPVSNTFFNTPINNEPTEPVAAPVTPDVTAAPDILSFDSLDSGMNMNPVAEPAPAPEVMPQQQMMNPTPEVAPTFVAPTEAPAAEPTINPFMESNTMFTNEQPAAPEVNPFVQDGPAVSINPFLEPLPEVAPTPVTPEVAPAAEPVAAPVVEPAPAPVVAPTPEVMPQPQMVAPTPEVAPQPSYTLPTANEIASMPGVVNPMDSVNNINNPAPEAKPVSNMNNAITEIRELAAKLESQGFIVNLEELALPDGYQVNINIKE